jgi:hypothetical protein
MTGIYVRILRDGQPHSVEVEDLSDAELQTWFASKDPEELVRWLVWLVGWIRDSVTSSAEDD